MSKNITSITYRVRTPICGAVPENDNVGARGVIITLCGSAGKSKSDGEIIVEVRLKFAVNGVLHVKHIKMKMWWLINKHVDWPVWTWGLYRVDMSGGNGVDMGGELVWNMGFVPCWHGWGNWCCCRELFLTSGIECSFTNIHRVLPDSRNNQQFSLLKRLKILKYVKRKKEKVKWKNQKEMWKN